MTDQGALNGTIGALVSDSVRLQLGEDALVVDFVNGCATRIYTSLGKRIDAVEPLLESLSRTSLSRALQLNCAEFEGPSTLAAL